MRAGEERFGRRTSFPKNFIEEAGTSQKTFLRMTELAIAYLSTFVLIGRLQNYITIPINTNCNWFNIVHVCIYLLSVSFISE